MDRKIGLPPSGSTMGNKALRIKNKLFAASTMTNLPSHSPALSSYLSRCERANAAHIITLNRQNRLTAASAIGPRVLVSMLRRQFSEILMRAADPQGVRALNRTSRHLSLRRASALPSVKCSCLSLPWDAARKQSAHFRREQVTPQYSLPGPIHAQRIAHTHECCLQTLLRSRAVRPHQLALLAGMRAHPSRRFSECWRARF